MFEDLLPAWGGEEVVVRFDEPSATWMFVGVHSTVLGPAGGGTRMKTYAEPADGLRDVLRLSSAMTSKMAMASVRAFRSSSGASRCSVGRDSPASVARERIPSLRAIAANAIATTVRTARFDRLRP